MTPVRVAKILLNVNSMMGKSLVHWNIPSDRSQLKQWVIVRPPHFFVRWPSITIVAIALRLLPSTTVAAMPSVTVAVALFIAIAATLVPSIAAIAVVLPSHHPLPLPLCHPLPPLPLLPSSASRHRYARRCCRCIAGATSIAILRKKRKNEKPFTFSCNVGKILGTQPPTKQFSSLKIFPFQKTRELFSLSPM